MNQGVECDRTASPYINTCKLDAAGKLLSAILPRLKEPSGDSSIKHESSPSGDNDASGERATGGEIVAFEQGQFLDQGRDNTLADTGYYYAPKKCSQGHLCKVHIVFHGCQQNADSIDRTFINNAGYNRWADANNIVVIYPQTEASFVPLNPKACWDWWGYTGEDYLSRNSEQLKHIYNMLIGLSQ